MERGRQRLSGIDLVKGLSVIGVILLHSLTPRFFLSTGLIYLVQPVSAFCFLLGVNLMLSSERHEWTSVLDCVRSGYIGRRLLRLLSPVCFSALVVLLLNASIGEPTVRRTLAQYIAGLPPIATGPGDYFIALYWQFIWIAPFLWLLSKRLHPAVFFLLCSLADVAFQLGMAKTSWGLSHYWLYRNSLLRYLSVVAAGQVLAGWLREPAGLGLSACWRKHATVFLYGVLGASMIYLQMYRGFVPFRLQAPWQTYWNGQNLLTVGLPVAIVYGLILAHSRAQGRVVRRVSRPLELVGEASWHIFLIQMVYFYFYRGRVAPLLGLTHSDDSLTSVAALAIILPTGMAFWYGETMLWRLLTKWWPFGRRPAPQ